LHAAVVGAVKGVSEERRERLIKLLDIDLSWNLIRTSDGQRRRVQIALGLMREYKVLLMDEITVDLDVLSRLDLLQFFKDECEVRPCACLSDSALLCFPPHRRRRRSPLASC
jgi:CCR4-NOT complex subunit CAF16